MLLLFDIIFVARSLQHTFYIQPVRILVTSFLFSPLPDFICVYDLPKSSKARQKKKLVEICSFLYFVCR